MALEKCLSCGKDVDSGAIICPNCGRPYPTGRPSDNGKVYACGCLFIIVLVSLIAQLNETLFSDPKPVQEAQRSLGYKYWSGACVVEKIEKTYFIGCRAKDANASASVYAVEIVGDDKYKLYAVNAGAADMLIAIEPYRGSIPAVTILDAFDAADDP